MKRVARKLKKVYSKLSPKKLKAKTAEAIRAINYRPGRAAIQSDVVLFESFGGKSVGDSPLDICLELQRARPDLKIYFTVLKGKSKAPEGTTGLVQGSAAWYRVLASAKYLVNNANFPTYFRKAPGQIYLQTWHGTPLKRIGKDILNDKTSKAYQAAMDRETSYWDYLISPSHFCSLIFPRAFRYQGELLEFGYPRNDRLVSNPSGVRERVREKLGVAADAKLVLYAPTWRDGKRAANGKWQAVNPLGPETVLPKGFHLAFRGHSNTHENHSSAISGRATDVTEYPDVTELYLAADVLITDYSSVMFDYSVTSKPMIILAPDLKQYEAERGFYFDFEGEVPAPIVADAKGVIAALKDLEANKRKYAKRYKAWRARFNSLEKGHAAKRVVERVFLVEN